MDALAAQAKKVMEEERIAYSPEEKSDKILLGYMNAKIKLIPNQKRNVKFSNELRQKISNEEFERDGALISKCGAKKITKLIELFKCKFKNGKNMNYHLSRQVFDSTRFDTLLNTWNIKRIHLSDKTSTSKSSMKKNRSEWLLFCIVKNDSVYFLDVLDHPKNENFTSCHFLQIAHKNNWMKHIGFKEIKDVKPDSLNVKITKDEDIYKLYKSCVNFLFEFEGKIYIPSFGIASSRDKAINPMNLIALKKFLREPLGQYGEYLCIKFDSADSLNGILYFREGSCKFYFEDIILS